MTAASPWSVKGIDPKAREVAKDLARRSGMTLGEWLNQMIIEGEPDAPPFSRSGYEADDLRPDAGYRSPSSRDYGSPGEPFRAPAQRSVDLQRVTRALDQLSARMEAAEQRSTLAISGIDQSVMGVLSRFESVEREQGAVAARFDGALEEVRQAQDKTNDKVRRLAEEDAPRVEAMKALETALGKMAEKLYEGETKTRGALNELREDTANLSRRMDRTEAKVEAEPASVLVDSVLARITARLEQAESKTSEAVRALETSFAGLDARLKAGESDTEVAGRRFAALTDDLSHKVESARVEMAERLRDAADGKLDKMEAAVRDLAGHVEQGEQRSAQAIDRMGREVMRIASTLGERVGKVESRSAEAVEQVGGEMARIADVIEQRMGRQDTLQAQALEKLGGEIGRIAEKLADRIANAERRSAQSIDDVGDQLGRVTERLNQRYDRANSDLADRIAQSEERTAKLLEEAQGKIDARLTEAQRRAALEVAADAARKAAEAQALAAAPEPVHPVSEPAGPFGVAVAADSFASDPFGAPAPFEAPPSSFVPEPSPFVPAEPARSFDGFGQDAFIPLVEPVVEPVFEPEVRPAVSSNREMLEQARAAARSASERPDHAQPSRGLDRRRGGSARRSRATPRPSVSACGRKRRRASPFARRLWRPAPPPPLAVTGAGAVLLVNSEMAGAPEHTTASVRRRSYRRGPERRRLACSAGAVGCCVDRRHRNRGHAAGGADGGGPVASARRNRRAESRAREALADGSRAAAPSRPSPSPPGPSIRRPCARLKATIRPASRT